MKSIYFLSLIMISFALRAQININNDGLGSIKLTANNCDILEKNYTALKAWKKKDLISTSADKTCNCLKSQCEIEISSILSNDIKNIEGKTASAAGPNCFNTALVDQGVLKYRRLVTTQEVKFWVKSSYCNEVHPEKKLIPGDMFIISHDETLPLHAFIYLSEDLVFSKGGPGKDIIYELTNFKKMFDYYNVSKECWHVQGEPDQKQCLKYSNVYRCQKLNFSELKTVKLNNIFKELDLIASSVETSLFSNDKSISVIHADEKLSKLRMKLIDLKQEMLKNTTDTENWNIAWHYLIGLDKQIGLL